jgi:hypothetical protein
LGKLLDMGLNKIEFKLGFSRTSAHFRGNQLEGKMPGEAAVAVEFAVVGEFTELSFHRSNRPPP